MTLLISEHLANRLPLFGGSRPQDRTEGAGEKPMINLNEIEMTPRDQQVLRLFVQGCSNKEIVRATLISARGR
jgi:DNA-binding NarL/FixJ family response regulator